MLHECFPWSNFWDQYVDVCIVKIVKVVLIDFLICTNIQVKQIVIVSLGAKRVLAHLGVKGHVSPTELITGLDYIIAYI